jgi:hypothetical protein
MGDADHSIRTLFAELIAQASLACDNLRRQKNQFSQAILAVRKRYE